MNKRVIVRGGSGAPMPRRCGGSRAMPHRTAAALLVLILMVGSNLVGQVSAPETRVIHELIADEIEPPTLPVAASEDVMPPLSVSRRGDEAIFGPEGFVSEIPGPFLDGPHVPRGAERFLDDKTNRVDRLGYHAVFDPHVAPFKRLVASEDVRKAADGQYVIANDSVRYLPVALEASSAGERFWGSFLLRTLPEQWQSFASVTPGQSIVQILVEPRVSIEVARDEADNYYVRSDHRGILRLNMEVVAPTFYFSGKMPERQWSDFRRIRGRDLKVDAAVDSILPEMGINRSTPPQEALLSLVEFFRDFQPGTFPSKGKKSADLYVTLVRKRLGVCRHRSIAFVITARSLGIRARLVTNEAHAFVEVYWPRSGWRRIDLGGASNEMDVNRGGSSRAHDPGIDVLPQPPNFLAEMGRGTGTDDASAEKSSGDNEHFEPAGTSSPEAADGDLGEREPSASSPAGPKVVSLPEAAILAGDVGRRRRPVRMSLGASQVSAIRGRVLVCDVHLLEEDGRPIIGKKVSVFIASVGVTDPNRGTRICEGLTDQTGRFRGSCSIPATQDMGRWNVFGYFAGDEERLEVVAE
jgi:hypothetical protein